jgi:prevent-host-death family protein
MASVELTVTHTHPATPQWTEIVEDASAHGQVLVTNDDRPDVVVMSVEEFVKLRQRVMDAGLAKVRAEIDRQVAVMNEPGSHERWRAIMDSTPQEFADAANAAEAAQRRRNS